MDPVSNRLERARVLKLRYVHALLRHPVRAWLGVAALTAYFAFELTGLQVNATPYILNREHPTRAAEADVRAHFEGTGEQALIVFAAKGETIYEPGAMGAVAALTEQLRVLSLLDAADLEYLRGLPLEGARRQSLEAILAGGLQRGELAEFDAWSAAAQRAAALPADAADQLAQIRLRAAPVRRVRSLASIENLTEQDGSLRVAPLFDAHAAQLDWRALRDAAQDNPLFRGVFATDSERATAIQVEFAIPEYDAPNMRRAHDAIVALVERLAPEQQTYLAGAPIVLVQVAKTVERDNATLFPVVLLVVAGLLYLSYRRWFDVFAPLLVTALAVLWSLGLMAACGIKLNIVTTILPVFLVAIGVADVVHFLSQYRSEAVALGHRDAIAASFAHVLVPIFWTAVTDVIGFLALGCTDLVFLREFGLFTAAGICFAFVLTVVVVPLLLLAHAPAPAARERGGWLWLERAVRRAAAALALRRGAALAACALLALVSLGAALRVEPGFTNIESFSADTELRRDTARIHEQLAGTVPVSLWLAAREPDAFTRPDVLRAIERLEAELRADPEVGYVISPASFVRRIHQVLNPGAPDALPENLTRELAAQYLLLYESGRGRDLRDVLDASNQNGRIIALAKTDQGADWHRILSHIERRAAQLLPPDVTLTASGYGSIMRNLLIEVVHSQIASLGISVLMIGGSMIALYRSVALGVIASLPLSLVLLTTFAGMALLGIQLNVGTAIVSGIVFGVGIDYAIHFLAELRVFLARAPGRLEDALADTAAATAKPMAINSLALSLGFAVLGLSSYHPIQELGMIMAWTLSSCAVLTVLGLPLLIGAFRPGWTSAAVGAAPAISAGEIAVPQPRLVEVKQRG